MNLDTDVNLSLASVVAPVDNLEIVSASWKFGAPLALRVVIEAIHEDADTVNWISLAWFHQVGVDEWIDKAVSASWVISWICMLSRDEQLLSIWNHQPEVQLLLGHMNILERSNLLVRLRVSDTQEVEVFEIDFEWKEVFAIVSKFMVGLLQQFRSPFLGSVTVWSLVFLNSPWISNVS